MPPECGLIAAKTISAQYRRFASRKKERGEVNRRIGRKAGLTRVARICHFQFRQVRRNNPLRDWSNGRSFVSLLRCSACVSNKPVSIVVARRSRHNRPASRSANSRSTAVGFEVLIVFGILQSADHCLGGETMAPRIAAGAALAFVRSRPGALRGVAPVAAICLSEVIGELLEK